MKYSVVKSGLVLSIVFGTPALFDAISHIGISSQLHAQPQKYEYKVYENRKEGVTKSSELVAGEKLVLLGASLSPQDSLFQSRVSATDFHLRFCLNSAARFRIRVRELQTSYQMEPLKRQYAAGQNAFSWPSEIIAYYNIATDALLPLAKVPQAGLAKVVPILLSQDTTAAKNLHYRFVFLPRRDVREITYKIYNLDTKELIYSRTLRDYVANQKIILSWDGKKADGQPVVSGRYAIIVKVAFQRAPGASEETITNDGFEFYHCADLIRAGFSAR